MAYIIFIGNGGGSLLSSSRKANVPSNVKLFDYQWISAHEIIATRNVDPNQTYNDACGTKSNIPTRHIVLKVDTRAGVAATAAFLITVEYDCGARYPEEIIDCEDSGRISPDDKWSMWVEGNCYHFLSMTDLRDTLVHIPISRNHYSDNGYPPYTLYSKVAWCSQRDEWVEVRSDGKKAAQLLVHSIDGKIINRGSLGFPAFVGPVMLGVTPQNHALIWDQVTELLDVDLSSPSLSEVPILLSKPSEGYVKDIVLSPDGKRLAWRTHVPPARRIPAWYQWVPRAFYRVIPPPDSTPSTGTHIVWVSNLDGSKMHEIGRQTIFERERGEVDNNDFRFSSFRWLPDGKRLSYVYDGALWTVPVN